MCEMRSRGREVERERVCVCVKKNKNSEQHKLRQVERSSNLLGLDVDVEAVVGVGVGFWCCVGVEVALAPPSAAAVVLVVDIGVLVGWLCAAFPFLFSSSLSSSLSSSFLLLPVLSFLIRSSPKGERRYFCLCLSQSQFFLHVCDKQTLLHNFSLCAVSSTRSCLRVHSPFWLSTPTQPQSTTTNADSTHPPLDLEQPTKKKLFISFILLN